jgi:hypothetical protein
MLDIPLCCSILTRLHNLVPVKRDPIIHQPSCGFSIHLKAMVCSSFWTQAKMFLHLVYRKMATCQIITMTIPIMLQENDPIVPSGGPSPDDFLGSTLNLLHCSAHIVLEIKLFVMKTVIQRIFSPSSFLHNC